MLQPGFHGSVIHRCLGGAPRFLPFSKRHGSGDPRSAPATRRAQTPAIAAALEFWRPFLLDHPPSPLARLDRRPPHCPTGDCGPLASRRVSTLLALALPLPSARRQTEDHPGTEICRTSGP